MSNLIWDNLVKSPLGKTPKTPKTPVFSLPNVIGSPSMLTPVRSRVIIPAVTISGLETLPVVQSFAECGYELIEQVGRGAFGTVSRAKHGDQEYAVKTFNIKRQESKDAFARELAAQLFIEKNPESLDICSRAAVCGITAFLVQNQNQNVAAIVYPFVVAGDLGDLISGWREKKTQKENFDEKASLLSLINIGVDFLRNIATLHEYGIAHRDIKPENILVRGNKNQSVLIDLGSACFYNDSEEFSVLLTTLLDKLQHQVGEINRDFSCIPIDTTLAYADPDLAMTDEIEDKKEDFEAGKKADIFAAAVVLFELFMEKRVTEFIKSKNPIELIKWRPPIALVGDVATKNSSVKRAYKRLAIFLEQMMKNDDSVDVYAEQLANIANLLQKETK